MHVEHSDTGIDHIHRVCRRDIGDGSAASHIHFAKLCRLKSDIENDVNAWLWEYGYEYGCEVAFDTEWYDTREYENFTLPKGYYTSLRVMLGEAEGKNWWCVMYPPLCLDIATEEAPKDDAVMGYTKEEYSLITEDGYNVKFKILELLSDAFSKNG